MYVDVSFGKCKELVLLPVLMGFISLSLITNLLR